MKQWAIWRDRSRTPAAQRGISLIEIMTALTLSLFLLLGLFGIFDSTRQIYSTQNGLAQLQERQRNAIALLSGIIQSAGHFPGTASKLKEAKPEATRGEVFPASSDSTYAKGASIFGTEVAAGNDSIRVRFQTAGGSNIPNCQGDTNTSAADVIYDNLFSINTSNQLACAVSTNGVATGSATVLVDGISGMDILYGVDPKDTGSSSKYVTASAVTDWSKVRSVKIRLTFVNPGKGNPGQPDSVDSTHVIQLIGNS